MGALNPSSHFLTLFLILVIIVQQNDGSNPYGGYGGHYGNNVFAPQNFLPPFGPYQRPPAPLPIPQPVPQPAPLPVPQPVPQPMPQPLPQPPAFPPVRLHNWGGTFRYSTQNIQYPQLVAEVQQIVANSRHLRVLGTRHSFSKIADSPDTMLDTVGLKTIIGLDSTVPSVTVQGGITYTDLAPFLHAFGFGLANLASLAEITVAGAIQTGTHGSGVNLGALATQVRSLQIVLANGSLVTLGPNDPALKAVAVGLGAFGVITQLELMLVPTYNVTLHVFLGLSDQQLFDHFDEIQQLGYSVVLLSDLKNPGFALIVNVRSDDPSNTVRSAQQLFGAIKAPGAVPILAGVPTTYYVEQGVEQPWYMGLPEYRFGVSGFDGFEIQTEYFLPIANAVPALKELAKLRTLVEPLGLLYGIRTVKGNDLWLSGAFGGPAVAIHFSWNPNVTAVEQLLPAIEQTLIPFKVRPHWGKFHTLSPQSYLPNFPKLAEFRNLAHQFDPSGKFLNDYLLKSVFSA